MREDCKLYRRFAYRLQQSRCLRWTNIAIWTVFLGVTASFAPGILQATSQAFVPPTGSPSAIANALMEKEFAARARSSSYLILLTPVNSSAQVLDLPSARNFTLELIDHLANPLIVSVVSYYSLELQLGADNCRKAFVSRDGKSTFIDITFGAYMTDASAFTFTDNLKKWSAALEPADLNVGLVGGSLIIDDTLTTAMGDLEQMDLIVLPLAFAVFALLLQSWRLMIIPVITLATSLAGAFGVVTGLAHLTPIYVVAPNLMMSISIAMTIDYALFMLSRFKEELQNGNSVPRAVEEMMATAGMTITVSSLTLQISFASLLVFPVNLISSLGLACLVALMICMMVNLTLVPTLLLTFPKFFSQYQCQCSCANTRNRRDRELNEESYRIPLRDRDDHEAVDPDEKGVWGCISRWTTSPGWNVAIVVVITALIVPVGLQVMEIATTDGWDASIARGTEVSRTYVDLSERFGAGTLCPFTVLITPRNDTIKALSEEFFNMATQALDLVAKAAEANLHDTHPEDITSAMYLGGHMVAWDWEVNPCLYPNATSCKAKICPKYNSIFCHNIRYTVENFVNTTSNRAAYALITLGWDPLGPLGTDWLHGVRALLVQAGDKYDLDMSISGLGSDSIDAIEAVYGLVPAMAIGTCAFVMVIVGLAFRTLVIPVRTIFTIALTLAWCYGWAVLTYQKGIFDWVGLAGVKAAQHAQQWVVPVVSFPIIVGISLDYDIFLITRIAELRDLGYSNRRAIQVGMCKTGHIITTAGIIMAVAFSGLLFSSLSACNELSFYMVFAVLFDTFAVRTFLVPSIMTLCGEANWWPRSMLTVKHTTVHSRNGQAIQTPSHNFKMSQEDYEYPDDY